VTLFPTSAERLRAIDFPAAALATMLTAWINVGRIVEAPERRTLMRADPAVTFSHLGALIALLTAPVAILGALVTGFHPPLFVALVSLIPAFLGGAFALWSRRRAAAGAVSEPDGTESAEGGTAFESVAQPAHAGVALRQFARVTFNVVVALERVVVSFFARLAQVVTSPLRDLNSGDAQDYLLFLVGLSVLILVLPLLR
jgi:hypothetical protein